MLKKLFFLIATLVFVSALYACSNDDGSDSDGKEGEAASGDNVNAEGFPIVDEELELTFFANKPAQNEGNDWNDILIWNEYRDLTNIDVNWNLVSPDALEENRNLALGSGDLPDAFFLAQLTNTDLLRYGSQGSFFSIK